MKLKVQTRFLAALLLIVNMVISSVSQAQQGFGYGMYPAMQGCGYPNGPADGASSYEDDRAEALERRKDLRKRKKEIENKLLPGLQRDRERYRKSITEVVRGDWASVIFEHMDNGKNCCILRPVESRERYETQEDAPPVVTPPQTRVPEAGDLPRIAPPTPPVRGKKQPPPTNSTLPGVDEATGVEQRQRTQPTGSSSNAEVNQSRMPALAGGEVRAGTDVENVAPDFEVGGGYGGGGGQTLCYEDRPLYSHRAWIPGICRPDGHVAPAACTHPGFGMGGRNPRSSECSSALDKYRKSLKEEEALQSELRQIESDLELIKKELKDLSDEKREMEADCPTGECYKRSARGGGGKRGGSNSSGIWGLLGQVAPMMVGAGVGYLADRQQKKSMDANNQALQKMGWPAQNYGYPFTNTMQGLKYGAVAGAQQGAWGCAPTMAGGGPMSPYGPGGPMGGQFYGPNGTMWGYPGLPGYPQLGGGMYNPGAFPMANGPWGNGFNPMIGQIGGGAFGGMPQFAGGFNPGMPMGPGGYPGAGFGGMPQFGGGFMPGQLGGAMMPPGMGGYPMMPGAGGFPGLGGGAMYPGMPGFSNGLGMPGGGFLAPTPWSPAGNQYQQQMIQMQTQQAQAQIEMYRRASDGSYAQNMQYMQLVQQANALNTKFSMFQSGYGGLTSGLGGYGSLGGGYNTYGLGAGLSLMPTVGTGLLSPVTPVNPAGGRVR